MKHLSSSAPCLKARFALRSHSPPAVAVAVCGQPLSIYLLLPVPSFHSTSYQLRSFVPSFMVEIAKHMPERPFHFHGFGIEPSKPWSSRTTGSGAIPVCRSPSGGRRHQKHFCCFSVSLRFRCFSPTSTLTVERYQRSLDTVKGARP